MPELAETMYCSQQICIPPRFPYLLRQFAKAAIRTQPTDLLKWSTAYFRCLSLNIPPPVKPRLEYPIPKDHAGITPGWLKALLYQLQNNQTIPYKVLWDRWTGACLTHENLIQILCLGGFTDPNAVPWLRFISLCASLLTENLTNTMILLCEILTEEPEGGSAMINLETFLDLYKFLANIDASKPMILKNIYFRDSLLALWRDRVEEIEGRKELSEESAAEASRESSRSITLEEEEKKDELPEVISCPSIGEDDYRPDEQSVEGELEGEERSIELEAEDMEKTEMEGEENVPTEEPFEAVEAEFLQEAPEQHIDADADQPAEEHEMAEELPEEEAQPPEDEQQKSQVSAADEEEPITESRPSTQEQQPPETQQLAEEDQPAAEDLQETEDQEIAVEDQVEQVKVSEVQAEPVQEGDVATDKEYHSVDTIEDETKVGARPRTVDEEKMLQEDLERLKALQQEVPGETDDELEKFKCRLIEDMPISQSLEEAIDGYGVDVDVSTISSESEKEKSEEKIEKEGSQDIDEKEKTEEYDDVYIDPIPGIGPQVPKEIVEVVCEYMKCVAVNQHGMVMPRNIRHYNCPPLEKVEY